MYINKRGQYIGLYSRGYIEVRAYFSKINDTITVYSLVKRKQSEKPKKKYYLEQTELMKQLKTNGCSMCGYNECDAALEFHHVNPENKKYSISMSFMSYNIKKIINELNKCILLCANCHRKIHISE